MKPFRKLLPDPFDLLFVVGAAAIVFGVAQFHHALAWIVAGVIAMRVSWLATIGQRVRERFHEIEQERRDS